MDRGALRIAVAVAPELGPRAARAEGGVVARNAAVSPDAHHLAQVVCDVLRMVEAGTRGVVGLPLAERHEERAVGPEREPRAVVSLARDLRRLPEDHRDVGQRRAGQLPAGHGGAVAAGAGFGVGPVDPRVRRRVEPGVERDVEQAALARCDDGGQPVDRRLGPRAVRAQDQHRAALLGHQHPAIGQESEAPGTRQRRVEHGGLRRGRCRSRRGRGGAVRRTGAASAGGDARRDPRDTRDLHDRPARIPPCCHRHAAPALRPIPAQR